MEARYGSGGRIQVTFRFIAYRLQSEEKSHKNEIVQMKMRLDQELAAKSEEISSMQSQLSRAKRERDTFRQMVDSAQRAIAELKSKDSFHRRESLSSLEEAAEGARAAVNTLQERVQSLEDELSDSRRETARCKTELATENSTWEMKLAQMQQKVNEVDFTFQKLQKFLSFFEPSETLNLWILVGRG